MSDNEKELPKISVWKKNEMSKRISFFKDLKGSKKGWPDSLLPECTRELGFCKCKPGKGPLMHNHDTNETFMPITGKWRCEWNEGDDFQSVDVGPCDVVSFPPGCARRFMNITENESDVEHVLLVVIAGNAPKAEFTEKAYDRISEFERNQS